ncbi:hypothetical protein GN958_ATG03672 [Phytophthora infestans]|uniref:Uncharacterized protein n=1 Tax=Phytophthora infestans TaxID=4787 RepID=A0A8S9V4U1_PHYIN|nr:hypothetical protein GN958_ATG03672 [Phytophthora infestans]
MTALNQLEKVLKDYLAHSLSANIAETTANFLGQSQPLFDLASRPRRSADPGGGSGAVRTAHVPLAPHRVDGDDLRQDFQFKTPVVDALVLDQLAGPGCAQLLGEQRRPSDRGQAVAQAERVHGRDDVAPAREQDIVGKDPVVYVRRSEEANLLE